MAEDLTKLGYQMALNTSTLARMNRRNPVKALNDARTEMLAAGVFGEYERSFIAEADKKIAELISQPAWQWQ